MVVNLAVNARDAMPKGGQIRVATSTCELGPGELPGLGPGRYALLTVSDFGAGMTEEVQAHLFEPFFTTKAHGKGTGLGLATVYGIVAGAGGKVTVWSAPARGTVVRVYLPLAPGDPDGSPEAPASTPRMCTGTILLVEDDALVRKHAARALRGVGYRVIEADDGAEALRLVGGQCTVPDLVVTDLVMARMGGRELLARLRERDTGVRVLFMTGHLDGDPEVEGVPVLHKPFTPAALASRVTTLLAAAREPPARPP